ncbi:hypothetical protein NPIL_189171 [Nephila pilipes]|uniref:Uncharacterized protein n=1 Tax=Nephila pilipes TaxID=299642 RepID=A0A8X6MM95_NEPPI|nr:hypothetical protein NPIL_189171 [Nephila pilipes]
MTNFEKEILSGNVLYLASIDASEFLASFTVARKYALIKGSTRVKILQQKFVSLSNSSLDKDNLQRYESTISSTKIDGKILLQWSHGVFLQKVIRKKGFNVIHILEEYAVKTAVVFS